MSSKIPNESFLITKKDEKYVDLAFELARKAYDLQEVPVGCVFVFNDEIIGQGHNDVNRTRNPTRHAEFVAVDAAIAWCNRNGMNFEEVIKQATLFVTLEPCIMCASALYQLKIAKIVFGARNPRFGGIGSVASNEQYGYEHEIQIISEVYKERSIELLKRFYGRENPFAPLDKRKVKNDGSSAAIERNRNC